MRHRVKVFSNSAAYGVALALACAGTAQCQVSLRQVMTQREAAAAARVQPLQAEVASPGTVEDALKDLASQAAVIFTGSVAKVTELTGSAARVDFVVEDGLRGVEAGSRYSMRVSAWAGGLERYRVGQRALFLLHAPSAQGFSSPVCGELGIIPLSGDALVGSVDLRWIATVVQRSVLTSEPAHSGVTAAAPVGKVTRTASTGSAIPFVSETAVMASSNSHVSRVRGASVTEQLASSNVTGNDVHAIDRDLVTGMLRTWAASSKDVR